MLLQKKKLLKIKLTSYACFIKKHIHPLNKNTLYFVINDLLSISFSSFILCPKFVKLPMKIFRCFSPVCFDTFCYYYRDIFLLFPVNPIIVVVIIFCAGDLNPGPPAH